jgi:hypothetical protein
VINKKIKMEVLNMSNTFAIKEVLDFTVESYASTGRGNILFSVDYAANTSIQTTGERLPIRGGQGNYKILDLDHTKDCMMNAMLPIVDINALAVKLGVPVTKGAATASRSQTLTTTGATPTIALASTPLTGSLKVYLIEAGTERDLGVEQTAGTPASTVNTYSITDNIITLNETSGVAGTKVFVSYEYTSGVNAQNVKITASDFPNFITIRGRGLVDDDQAGTKVPVSFKIHKAKVKPEFELTMAGDAATELSFEVDCYTTLNNAGIREYIDIVKLSDESLS